MQSVPPPLPSRDHGNGTVAPGTGPQLSAPLPLVAPSDPRALTSAALVLAGGRVQTFCRGTVQNLGQWSGLCLGATSTAMG